MLQRFLFVIAISTLSDAFLLQHGHIPMMARIRSSISCPALKISRRGNFHSPMCCLNPPSPSKDTTMSEKQAQFDFYVSVGAAKSCVPIMRKNDGIKVTEEQVFGSRIDEFS